MSRLKAVLLSCALTFPLHGGAQPSFSAFGGVSNYQGDIAKDVTNLKETHVAFGGGLGWRLSAYFDFKANILFTRLTGDDANYPERVYRGFRFKTDLVEMTGIFEYYMLGSSERSVTGVFVPRVTPLAYLGLGVVKLNNEAECYSQDCQKGIVLNPFPEPGFKSLLIDMPIGIGIKYDVSPTFAVGLKGGYRYTFSDYLDGISVTANEDKNDWYFVLGLDMTFYLQPNQDKDPF